MDGTFTDISWVHCVQPASQKTILSYAFRRAIKEIIIEFKHTQLKNSPCCPILHIPLDFYNSHVSYTTPRFDKLFLNFLEEYDHTICSIELKNPDKNDTDPRGIIKDPIIRNYWINYHKSNTQLELISEKANLSKKYKI
ncbi:TPA: hypothetical protein ACKRC9_000324 [Proteus mirabilis]|uniref:hypothetical protein n=1 Tax=Proteus mirabilis TaxID=584 RepID=UPI0034D63A33